MRIRRLLLLSPAALALLAVPAGAHEGDHPTAVGWWTSTPGAGEAPEDGFEVAAFASEPVSMAAVRFAVEGSPTTATLTLVESGGTVTAATALQVCVPKGPWEPADPGPMSEAPEADCSAAVDLTRDEAAKTWKGEVGTLLGAGSLLVVPAEAAAGGAPVDPGFRVTFSEAALATTAAPSASSSPAFASPTPAASGGGGSFTAPAPASGASPSFGAAPLPDAGAGATPTTVAEQAVETGGGATEAAAGSPSFTDDGGGGGEPKPWGRLLLLVPLSAAGGYAAVRGRKVLEARGVVEA